MAERRPWLRRRLRRPVGEEGFTLLELMISMTLLTLMIAMTYSIFDTAMRAVPRGEAEAERSARLRGATDIMTRQIRSLFDYTAQKDGESFPYFEGGPYWFRFITASPQHRGGEGLGWVTYWSDGHTLSVGERVIFSASAITGEAPEMSDQGILLDGFNGSRFQYLRLDGNDSEWRDDWDGREEQTLPAAIRIVLDGLRDGASAWVQEIPVMTVAYALGSYDPKEQSDADGDIGDGDNTGDGGTGAGPGSLDGE